MDDHLFWLPSKLESGEKIILEADQRPVPLLLHEFCAFHSGMRRVLIKITPVTQVPINVVYHIATTAIETSVMTAQRKT